MKVYVTTMYRWGIRENHSYVLGVFQKAIDAKIAGDDEHQYRGGKYEYEVLETELDAKADYKRVFKGRMTD